MRIAFLTHQWPGIRMGGIGSYVRQSAEALARSGHDIHVFTLTLPADVRSQVPTGVRVHEVEGLAERVRAGALPAALSSAINGGGEGIYRLAMGWLLYGAFLEEHGRAAFDIVETPDVEGLGLPLMLNGALGVPVVTHLHCCTAMAYQANGTEVGESQRLMAALEFAAIGLGDARCAATEAVVRGTRELMGADFEARIIPHAFVCGSEPFTVPPVGGGMVFVGRIERLKGVEAIAGALNLFLPKHPEAQFRFLGTDTSTGPGGASMVGHLKGILSKAVVERVHFLGEMTQEQIQGELRGCSFVVMPSLSENFSMALCEAMNAGRTAIVGAGTGSVEQMGDAGVAVERNDPEQLAAAMERLWANRKHLNELSQRAYERVRTHCAPGAIARARGEFYQETITAFRRDGRKVAERLAALPGSVVAAVLPALANLTGVLAGLNKVGQTPGSRLLAIMEGLSQNNGKGPVGVWLYGAGRHTARLLAEREVWETRGHKVVGLIDDHPRFAEGGEEGRYLDLPVQSMKGAAKGKLYAVVLSTDTYQDQFWEQTEILREKGTPVFRLYT